MDDPIKDMLKKVCNHTDNPTRCCICGSDKVQPNDFEDYLSRREFQISQMCQVCQNKVFKPKKNKQAAVK